MAYGWIYAIGPTNIFSDGPTVVCLCWTNSILPLTDQQQLATSGPTLAQHQILDPHCLLSTNIGPIYSCYLGILSCTHICWHILYSFIIKVQTRAAQLLNSWSSSGLPRRRSRGRTAPPPSSTSVSRPSSSHSSSITSSSSHTVIHHPATTFSFSRSSPTFSLSHLALFTYSHSSSNLFV